MKENKGAFTKMLAIVGAILVWIPLLAPVVFSVIFLIRSGMFRFDYLMPAEVFYFSLLGGVLLIWAARRARVRWGMIGWGLAIAVAMFVLSGAIATLTGLASGKTQPGGWQWALVLTALVVFILAEVVIAVGGIALLRDLLRAPHPPVDDAVE